MAGMHVWVPGEEATAANLQGYIQNQVVPVFTTAAQRDAQWPSPPRGAHCFTLDTGVLQQRGATAWGAIYTAGLLAAGINAYPGSTLELNALTHSRAVIATADYTSKSLQIYRLAGSTGTGGVGFSDLVISRGFQMQGYLSGQWGCHFVEWNNATHIPVYALAFTVAALRAEARSVATFDVDALDVVGRLRAVRYETQADPLPRDDGTIGPTPPPVVRIGLMADDVAEPFADAVDANDDGPVGYDLVAVVALLTKAVQELTARVAALEAAP